MTMQRPMFPEPAPVPTTTRRGALRLIGAAAVTAPPTVALASPADAALFQLEAEFRALVEAHNASTARWDAANKRLEELSPPAPAVIYATKRDAELGFPEPGNLGTPGCYCGGQIHNLRMAATGIMAPASLRAEADARVNAITVAVEAWYADRKRAIEASGVEACEDAHSEVDAALSDFIRKLADVPAESLAGLQCKARMTTAYIDVYDDPGLGMPEEAAVLSIVRDLATGKYLNA